MRVARPLGAMLALLVGPLVLAEAGGWTGGRAFEEELGSTLGISALCVLAIVLVLPTRLRVLAGLGADAAVRLHRHLVGVLLALIVGHVALAVGLQPARYALLRFFGQPWRAQAAAASVICLLALIGLSVWRQRLRMPYAAWRALHGGLAAACLILAVVHTYGWHRYLGLGAGALGLGAPTAGAPGGLAAPGSWPRLRRGAWAPRGCRPRPPPSSLAGAGPKRDTARRWCCARRM